jgi:hypothetical protein
MKAKKREKELREEQHSNEQARETEWEATQVNAERMGFK